MTQNRIPEGACEKTRGYLDSYISNELLVETNHEVLRHLEDCPTCSAEMETRSRLRTRLKSAVQTQPVPPELHVKIRERLARERPGFWSMQGASRWVMAAACATAVFAGVWVSLPVARLPLPALGDRPAQTAYIQKISATLSAVLKVGLGDHIHCSIFRKYPQNPPPVEQMESSLGPSYQGLLPLVAKSVPEGYRVVMAHQCGYAGRKFVHLTLRKDETLLSLVIARKNEGESLSVLAPESRPSGVPVYQAAAQQYEVAAFEAGQYFAFVVSDLRGRANLHIATTLAPPVADFLGKA